MKNIAVILAGGMGSRFGSAKPKQFLEVAGKMVIEYTIDAFDVNSNIDEVAIVMNPAYVSEMEQIVHRNCWHKVRHVLKGGDERYMSTFAAIEAYRGNDDCNLIFHDAVRPLVSQKIINNVVSAMEKYEAVGVAIPVTDTIFQIDADNETVVSIPQRSILRRAQTPQAFRYSIISKAYELALKDANFKSTDDCSVVLHYLHDVKIHLIEGEEKNIKLTYKEDIPILEKYSNGFVS